MEIIVGAIVLMWIWSALSGEKSNESKMGWMVLIIISMIVYSIGKV